MYVLTVRQPWAWAICHAGKDVENRSWPTALRERIGIHAGVRVDHAAVEALREQGYEVPDELPTGVIVCTTRIADCVRDASSRWARPGVWQWALRDTRTLDVHVPHRGNVYLTTSKALDSQA